MILVTEQGSGEGIFLAPRHIVSIRANPFHPESSVIEKTTGRIAVVETMNEIDALIEAEK